jgi:hypothetical protein
VPLKSPLMGLFITADDCTQELSAGSGKFVGFDFFKDEAPPPQDSIMDFATRQAVCLSGGPRAHFLFVF